jgi:iron complex outermembrane receptor protein
MLSRSRSSGITVLLALGAAISSAQQLTISGTVSDPQGVVPGTSVTLRAPGGATRQAVTDAAGKYSFDGLIAGPYEVSFAREGFATATRNLSLTVESRTLDVTLSVAGVATSVDVVDVGGKATGSRMEIPDREIPAYVAVIPQRVLQEQGINNLATALENASGVLTQVQYGVYEWYTIGGFTQQSGNDFLYVDGMTLTGNRPNTQLNNIEEIQVLKGPSGALYGGAGAGLGGMVNVIRKKPQAQRVQDLLYRGGPWGLQQVTGGAAGQIFGLQRVLYRLDSSFSREDGWRDAGSRRFNASPALTWLIHNRMRINFNESLTRDRYDLDAGVPVSLLARPGFPLDRRLNPPTDFDLFRDWQNQITFHYHITNRLQLRNGFLKSRRRDQYLDAETLAYDPATDILTRTELYFQHNRRPVQNQTDVIGDYQFLGLRHRFTIGYNYEDHKNFTHRTGPAAGVSNSGVALPIAPLRIADFLQPGFVDPAGSQIYTRFPRTRVDHSTNAINAAYWQDQIDITRRFRINLAGRYDDWKRRVHNDDYNNDQFVRTGPDAGQRHQTNYNYRAGAVYSVTDNHSAYFSSASSFQPITVVPADGRQFEPETSRSYEGGYRFQGLRGRLSVNSAYRRIFRRNVLVPIGPQLFEQAGQTSSHVVDFDALGELGRGFFTASNYGFADARYDDFRQTLTGPNLRGNRLPHAPRHQAKLWITKIWKVGESSSITGSIGGRYVYHYFSNAANTIVVPGRFTINGAVGLRRPKWDVMVNLENLGDKERYFVSQINGGNQLYPGPPFHAFVTLRYRFD